MGVYSDLLQDIARRASQLGIVVSDPSRPISLGLTADALAALTDPSAILDHLARLGDAVERPRLA